ncbi:hypothetical protein LP52_18195 [Streptomonospora alba]|uniref:Type I restriction modification DNA specificity domain-containing protein n=1 Tax=Streptomonospora alba TaxID=183763 RepID=A0A0C2J859_9ACTN|nr:hypothetical protein [Streptomonospora alba]KIH97636.1 hypothetical protein LP52_18195 [Streptomonospora alba]
MKIADIHTPVKAAWLAEQGLRLDPRPYVSEAFQAGKALERMPGTMPLAEVSERIFHPGISSRHWTTDQEHGVPFLGSAAIFQADLSHVPMITKDSFTKTRDLALEPGWTLITRSGMSAGRITCSRPDMDGQACSEHVMRVVPDTNRIPAGYLYAFLVSPYGKPIVQSRVYGTSIKHLEARHVADIPIPRFGAELEDKVDGLMQQSLKLRSQVQANLVSATEDLFRSAGMADLINFNWHGHRRDLDFSVRSLRSRSFRALNYSPRSRALLSQLGSVPHVTLGDLCAGGLLSTGKRFKRVEATPKEGVRLIGQRQAFWSRPYGRWINPLQAPSDIRPPDETVLVAAHGTLGEREVYGRSILVTGNWLQHAFGQDFLRVRSKDEGFPGAYLFAFFRSEVAFRILRSMSVGGKQQEYHPELLRSLPVPECTPEDRQRIADTVRQAYRWRDEADMREDEALSLVEEAVRETAG